MYVPLPPEIGPILRKRRRNTGDADDEGDAAVRGIPLVV
jgi:hypothetical protein